MSQIPNELIDQLTKAQTQIWQATTSIVSEAVNQTITFSNPITASTKATDVYSELSGPRMVVQFSFASQPESSQVILISQETVSALGELITGSAIEDIDENIVADLRGMLEAMVQGICLGVGNATNGMMVATGLSIRFQIFTFPPNLQRAEQLIRAQVALTADDVNGSVIWLMDQDTAGVILGSDEDGGDSPFASMPSTEESENIRGHLHSSDDQSNLERLIDVPLEMSVELGRVKMLVRDILDLGNGSILEIDKAAGEPVDVLVNGQLMAKGEVVVIEDNFGVRITEIISSRNKFG